MALLERMPWSWSDSERKKERFSPLDFATAAAERIQNRNTSEFVDGAALRFEQRALEGFEQCTTAAQVSELQQALERHLEKGYRDYVKELQAGEKVASEKDLENIRRARELRDDISARLGQAGIDKKGGLRGK